MMGVSDLRRNLEDILVGSNGSTVIIEKRHKPLAVLMSDKEYQRIQQLLDMAEDIVLGYLAEQRHKNSKAKDYVAIETLLKKAGS